MVNPVNLLDQFVDEIKPILIKQQNHISELEVRVNEKSDSTSKLEAELEEEKAKLTHLSNQLEEMENKSKQDLENLEHSYGDRMAELEAKVDPLAKENDRLTRRMKGLENTIKVISQWVPSQQESIEVLVALASAPDEFHSFEDISNLTKMPAVVLKSRITPMLEEKGFVVVDGDKLRMKSFE